MFKLDWVAIDSLIREHLPNMTCVEFCKKYPYTIPKTIGVRARKLGVKPAIKTISVEHRQAVSKAMSKFQPTEEIDQVIKDNYDRASIKRIAASVGWSHYAVKKRMTELGLKQSKRIIDGGSKLFKQPESNRIDWGKFDHLLREHLPSMTIREFQVKYMPEASDKAVGARAMKLGISPAQYKPDEEHKSKIAESILEYDWTSEQDKFILDNKDNLGQVEIAEGLGVSHSAVGRRMGELGIKRSFIW